MKKTICVVTGSRADFGIFLPLLGKIKKAGDFNLQLIATGSHLSAKFGSTYREIGWEGYKITRKIDIELVSDSEIGICRSIGLGVAGFAEALNELKPDLVILLGDRFEILACAIASHVSRIPIAHIHGGERTEGAIDDAFRHAITKMSLLHFPSAEEYRHRIIQLGESPDRVFNVGALGIDNIKRCRLLDKAVLEKKIGFKFAARNILVTFHPVTLESGSAKAQFKELLDAIDSFRNIGVVFTKPNADTGNKVIRDLMDAYVKKNKPRVICFDNMGTLRYLSALRAVTAVVGNSSSGIIEAPSFGIPTVSIGDRQNGRLMAKSIINCKPRAKEIRNAIKKALSPEYIKFCKTVTNPHGNGDAAEKIYKVIKAKINSLPDIKKTFYTIGEK
jgi:UDP-N-acetyl-D-glucosamine 2-epimerase, UDP-hydrolysing